MTCPFDLADPQRWTSGRLHKLGLFLWEMPKLNQLSIWLLKLSIMIIIAIKKVKDAEYRLQHAKPLLYTGWCLGFTCTVRGQFSLLLFSFLELFFFFFFLNIPQRSSYNNLTAWMNCTPQLWPVNSSTWRHANLSYGTCVLTHFFQMFAIQLSRFHTILYHRWELNTVIGSRTC